MSADNQDKRRREIIQDLKRASAVFRLKAIETILREREIFGELNSEQENDNVQ